MKSKSVAVFDYKSIKTFEDACTHLGIDSTKLPDVTGLLEEFRKPIVAYYKLQVIYKAINNGWKPDWSDDNDQYKYFPWFEVLSSGFGFSASGFGYGHSSTFVGSRLCTDSREKAIYIGETFREEYKDFFLYTE